MISSASLIHRWLLVITLPNRSLPRLVDHWGLVFGRGSSGLMPLEILTLRHRMGFLRVLMLLEMVILAAELILVMLVSHARDSTVRVSLLF